MGIGLLVLIFAGFISLLGDASVVANDRQKGREAFEEAKRNTQKKMNAWAKEQNVYYTGWMTLVDHNRNYDGTPKNKG